MQNEKKGTLLALLGGTLWGLCGTCGQFLFSYSDIQPQTVTIYRLLGTALSFLVVNMLSNRENMKAILSSYKTILHTIAFGLLGVGLCQLSYMSAIKHSNSGTASILQNSGILIVFLFSCIRTRKKPKALEVFSLLLIITGVFLLSTHGNLKDLVISQKGLVWGLVSAVALSFNTLLPGSLMKKFGTTVVLCYAMLTAGLFLSFTNPSAIVLTDFRPVTILCLLFMVVFGTAFAFFTYMKGLQLCGAKKACMLSCCEPVVAALSSWALLGTPFVGLDLLGFVAAIVGITILSSK